MMKAAPGRDHFLCRRLSKGARLRATGALGGASIPDDIRMTAPIELQSFRSSIRLRTHINLNSSPIEELDLDRVVVLSDGRNDPSDQTRNSDGWWADRHLVINRNADVVRKNELNIVVNLDDFCNHHSFDDMKPRCHVRQLSGAVSGAVETRQFAPLILPIKAMLS
jgi:hypothetical protein